MQIFLELQCLVYHLVDFFRTIKVYVDRRLRNEKHSVTYHLHCVFQKNSYELCKLMTFFF